MRVWCVQKQNGDSLMEPHIPIRLTVDFSHTHCQVGWGGGFRGGGGNEEKSGTKYCSSGSARTSRDPEVGNTCTLHTSDDVHRTVCHA